MGSYVSEQKPLSTYQMASYGGPALPLSMVGLPLAVYLTPVYADSAGFGLSLGFVGLVLALSRVRRFDRPDYWLSIGSNENC